MEWALEMEEQKLEKLQNEITSKKRELERKIKVLILGVSLVEASVSPEAEVPSFYILAPQNVC